MVIDARVLGIRDREFDDGSLEAPKLLARVRNFAGDVQCMMKLAEYFDA